MTAEPGRATHEQALRDAEAWFLRHGLPYFVESERAHVKRGLSRARLLPVLAAAVVLGLAAGAGGRLPGRRLRRDRDGPAGRRAARRGLRRDHAAAADHRALGGRPDLRQPRHAVPAGDPGAAAAAAVRDLPVHQHRGLDGRELPRPWRAVAGGDVLRGAGGRLPAGAAARGDGPGRRRRRRRGRCAAPAEGTPLERGAAEVSGPPTPTSAAVRRGHRPAEVEPGAGAARLQSCRCCCCRSRCCCSSWSSAQWSCSRVGDRRGSDDGSRAATSRASC